MCVCVYLIRSIWTNFHLLNILKSYKKNINFLFNFLIHWDFPGGSDDKVSAYNVGDPGSIPGLGRSSGEGNDNLLPVLLPGKSCGWKSLIAYNPWGHKESDMTERLN